MRMNRMASITEDGWLHVAVINGLTVRVTAKVKIWHYITAQSYIANEHFAEQSLVPLWSAREDVTIVQSWTYVWTPKFGVQSLKCSKQFSPYTPHMYCRLFCFAALPFSRIFQTAGLRLLINLNSVTLQICVCLFRLVSDLVCHSPPGTSFGSL